MTTNVARRSRALAALACAACGDAVGASGETESGSELSVRTQDLASEMRDGSAAISHVADHYRTSPDIAATQWATASLDNASCSGVMIGPNLMLTAAHCGAFHTRSISFRTYREDSHVVSDTETFQCGYLLQTFDDTDAALYYCEPGPIGAPAARRQNPGDKYGYVEFDVSAPRVGQPIYSHSANPLQEGTLARDARLLATGEITQVDLDGWFVPDANPRTGIAMHLWGEPGMSGSPHFAAANHQLLVAPLSTASGWSRQALSMHDLLYWGRVERAASEGVTPTVNTARVSSLGLTPEAYYGYADDDLDWQFDIQTDLERLRGEARRNWYFLGAESRRRNALWDLRPYASFDVPGRSLRINRAQVDLYEDAAVHPRLNLVAGTYRISLMTNTLSASVPAALRVALKDGNRYLPGTAFVTTRPGAGWQMHTLEISAPVDNVQLVFGVTGRVDLQVSAVSVVRDGTVLDFDSFDQRINWRNEATGARALVVPDGRAQGSPNWAVYVMPTATGFPVRNRQLAFVQGRRYRMCFDARRLAPESPIGEVVVMSAAPGAAAGIAVGYSFVVGASWQTHCTPPFSVPHADSNLMLRVVSGGAYVVDNLSIRPER